MNNFVFKSVKESDGPEIIKYLKSLGVNTRDYEGTCCEELNDEYIYYGVIYGKFDNYNEKAINENNVGIMTIPNDFKNKYPKMMMMEKKNNTLPFRVNINIVAEATLPNNKTIYIEELNNKYIVWDSLIDIPEEQIIELTIEEIAEKFNTKPECIRIKDKIN